MGVALSAKTSSWPGLQTLTPHYGDCHVPAIEYRELTRFLLAGGLATAGNLAAVWAAGIFMSFKLSLLVGIGVGMTISFFATKIFAFRARDWSRSGHEAGRFLLVYGIGLVLYWSTALVAKGFLIKAGLSDVAAESAAVIVGAGVMLVTSYFGHRFFTYSSAARGDGA